MARPLVVNRYLTIPATELSLAFSRSSGAGGQNVNKVNSKATLRWHFNNSKILNSEAREKFILRSSRYITKEGDFLVSSSESRDQVKNIESCYQKLKSCILNALKRERKRIKTKPSKGSIEKRRVGKKFQSEKKKYRKHPSFE